MNFTEIGPVDVTAADAAINGCYGQALREFAWAEEAVAETYLCFFDDSDSQLELSIHRQSLATLTFKSQSLTEPRLFGFLSVPLEYECTVGSRDEALAATHRFFESDDANFHEYLLRNHRRNRRRA